LDELKCAFVVVQVKELQRRNVPPQRGNLARSGTHPIGKITNLLLRLT